jgi:hypothetical protein
MKFGFLILIAFPSNVQINSRPMESDGETERQRDKETKKQEIEPSKEKQKMMDYFKINCICSSFGDADF